MRRLGDTNVRVARATCNVHPLLSTPRKRNTRLTSPRRRFARYRNYLQWRAAFGSVSWERVLQGAAVGNGSFAYISAAGEMLSELLTKEPPAGVDSVILLRQPHYWPRGGGWGGGVSSDDAFAPTMVAPCAYERAAVMDRVHFTTEIVDFRARYIPSTRSVRYIVPRSL